MSVQDPARSESAPRVRAMTVVVVEDDPASADVLQRRLRANGMEVSVGADGASGLALVRKLKPDLILLDVGLPDTDGYDVCLRIKSDAATADIPVVFLSARGDVFDKVRGLSCGASDYLTKPFHPAELLARVEAVLLQARRGRRAGADRTLVETPSGKPAALVALGDAARRTRAERLLASQFEIVAPGDGRVPELVLIDLEGEVPALPDESVSPAVLRVAPDGELPATPPDVVAIDQDLLRIADLTVRERRLRRDVHVAAEALILLATAFESADRLTEGRSERVAARAVATANALGLDEPLVDTIRIGALLRDIGNVKLPASLVRKAELTADERAQLQRHTILGAEVLAGFRPLAAIQPIVRSHHEHLNGSGYPDGLRGDQLPLSVRIVSAADRFEALVDDRPDRAAVPAREAVVTLRASVVRGELDPAVVAALATTVRGDEGAR